MFYGSVKLRRAPFEGQMLFSIEFLKLWVNALSEKKTIMKYFTFSSESMQSMCFAFWIEKLEWIKHFSIIFRCMKMHQECDKQIQEKYIFLISVLEACFLCICVSIYCTVIKSVQVKKIHQTFQLYSKHTFHWNNYMHQCTIAQFILGTDLVEDICQMFAH